MRLIYSAHEAKTRFSELLRLVRSGQTVAISYGGEPVAEIRSLEQKPQTIEERLDEMERRGILVRSRDERRPLAAVTRTPGALDRFLAERGE